MISRCAALRRSRLPLRFEALEARITPSTGWDKPHVPGELMVHVANTQSAFFDTIGYVTSRKIREIDLQRSHLTLQDTASGLVQVKLQADADEQVIADLLEACPRIDWVAPNFVYDQSQVHTELTPNDPQYGAQYALTQMQVPQAWNLNTGSGSVIVAVLDEGIITSHPDFNAQKTFWVNDDPVNFDGQGKPIDDDGNGYANDYTGWDFVDNDASVDPIIGKYHGNFVAGLVAATTNNGVGIAGIAGGDGTKSGVKIMPVRVYSGSGSLTSANVVGGLNYAADNGAKIINMSLKSDAFAADANIAAALDYTYDTKKCLIFFSAGNDAQDNPTRTQYTHPIYVAATDSVDKLWTSTSVTGSNYGTQIDLSAPGANITSTYNTSGTDTYTALTGTSAAAPNAAGVAALLWSKYPTHTRDQVAAIVLGSADNIDTISFNAPYAGKLGTGRVNAYRALTDSLSAPTIDGIIGVPQEGGFVSNLMSFSINAASRFLSSSVVASSFELRGDGPDNAFGTGDDIVVPLTVSPYRAGSNSIDIQANVSAFDRYRLTIKSGVGGLVDPFGVALDGNSDGTAGDGVVRTFYAVGSKEASDEFVVSTFTANTQGHPRVAMDDAGNSIVVWHSNGQDGSGYGIYGQRFNSAGKQVGAEFRINSFTTGDQKWMSVALDADGDAFVAWQSSGQDGSGYGIYGQRFDKFGNKTGGEFQINTYTTNSQWEPNVAMDDDGDAFVTWYSRDQDGSHYGVYGQRFDSAGNKVGGEFPVNTNTAGFQDSSAVAVDSDGDAVVVWRSQDQDGSVSGVYGQRFDILGNKVGGEFQVNTFTPNQQGSPSVAFQTGGSFLVVWSSDGQDGSGFGVYGQRFDAAGLKVGGEFQVNTYTTGDQRLRGGAAVSADMHGNAVITWDSAGQDGNSYGSYAQRFDPAGNKVGAELLVNAYTTGEQRGQAVAVDALGTAFIAWHSDGQDGSGLGVYGRRFGVFTQTSATVVQVRTADNKVLDSGERSLVPITGLMAGFDQSVGTAGGVTGPNSVTNPANWKLTRDAADISSEISGITFAYNATTFLYEATLSLSSPLNGGNYVLTAKQAIQDSLGNPIDGDGNGVPGGDFNRDFKVVALGLRGNELQLNNYTTGTQGLPVTAALADGSYVAVWHSPGLGEDGAGIYGRHVNADGTGDASFKVNQLTTGNQMSPAVASNASGQTVVTWEGPDGDGTGIFARLLDSAGVPIGNDIAVNDATANNQTNPTVAVAADGSFVVAWETSDGGSDLDIMYRRLTAAGVGNGIAQRANQTQTRIQSRPDIAFDAQGNFLITWQDQPLSQTLDVYARGFDSVGNALAGDVIVNATTAGHQQNPAVAGGANGFIITWASDPVGNQADYDVYYRRVAANGTFLTGESRVNSTTQGYQWQPDVAADGDGNFVIGWASNATGDYDVLAQRYSSAGTKVGAEFRLNTHTVNSQDALRIAANKSGDLLTVFESLGTDGDGWGVYSQLIATDVAPAIIATPTITVNEDGPATTISLAGVFADPTEPYRQLTYGWSTNNPSIVQASVDASTEVLTLTYPTNANGLATIGLNATDVGGLTTSMTFTVTVTPVNDPPSFVKGKDYVVPSAYAVVNVPWATSLSAGPPDEVGQTLSFEVISGYDTSLFAIQPSINANGTLSFQPSPGAFGAAVLQVRIRDDGLTANGGIDYSPIQTLVVTVSPGFEHSPILGGSRVNTTTTGLQLNTAVASDREGNYVVVWSGPDANGMGVYAQQYAADRTPVGTEMQVNVTTTGSQNSPDVGMDEAGNFVVTWRSANVDGDSDGIVARRWKAVTKSFGNEFVVNTTTTAQQDSTQIAMDGAGQFAITWHSNGADDGSGTSIRWRRYDANANPLTPGDQLVNTSTTGNQTNPDIAIDEDGDFVIAWASAHKGAYDIYLQRYSATGAPLGGEVLVNTATSGDQKVPSVDMDADGDFVVCWTGYQSGNADAYFQRFTSAGAPAGIEGRANAYTTGDQKGASVAVDADGDFCIVWSSVNQATPTSGFDVFHRFYTADGVTTHNDKIDARVNRIYTGDQQRPAIACDADGDTVIVWDGQGSVDLDGIAVQRNTYYLPEETGLPSKIVPGGTIETSVSLFDFYLDDINSSEAASIYEVLNISNLGLVDTADIDSKSGILRVRYKPYKHGEADVRIRVRDTTELPLEVILHVSVLPQAFPPAVLFVDEGTTYSPTMTGSTHSDPAHYDEWKLISGPAGMTINKTTGAINWTAGDGPTTANFKVRLSDFDSEGLVKLSWEEEFTLTVNNLPPTATGLSGPATVAVGGTATFTLDGVMDAPSDTATLKYDFDWDGDGNFDDIGLTSPSKGHTFNTAGPVTIKARVRDKDGGESTVFEKQISVTNAQPPTVLSAVLGSGSQRSTVKQLVVTFSEAVTFTGADAFKLTRTGTGGSLGDVALTLNPPSGPASMVTITFSGGLTQNGSLIDGLYDFQIIASKVTGAGGAMASDFTINGTTANKWFRLFGDANGDGFTDNVDLIAFRAANGSDSTAMNWNPALDFNNDGFVDNNDFLAFRARLGVTV